MKFVLFGTKVIWYLSHASPAMYAQSMIVNVEPTSEALTGYEIWKIAVPPGSSVPPITRLVVFSLPGVGRTPLQPEVPS